MVHTWNTPVRISSVWGAHRLVTKQRPTRASRTQILCQNKTEVYVHACIPKEPCEALGLYVQMDQNVVFHNLRHKQVGVAWVDFVTTLIILATKMWTLKAWGEGPQRYNYITERTWGEYCRCIVLRL